MNEVYVLSVVDNGIIQAQIARASLKDLFALAYQTIIDAVEVDDEDDSESNIYTEDGYARIMKLDLASEEDGEHVWGFSFDGDNKLKDEIAQQIEALEPSEQ